MHSLDIDSFSDLTRSSFRSLFWFTLNDINESADHTTTQLLPVCQEFFYGFYVWKLSRIFLLLKPSVVVSQSVLGIRKRSVCKTFSSKNCISKNKILLSRWWKTIHTTTNAMAAQIFLLLPNFFVHFTVFLLPIFLLMFLLLLAEWAKRMYETKSSNKYKYTI